MSMILDLETLLWAYSKGIFPMSDSAESEEYSWYLPPSRAIIPLNEFKISRSLRRTINKRDFAISFNTCFSQVVEECGNRDETWLSPPLKQAYNALHEKGYAQSVECWSDSQLVGGLYGITLNGLFAGESMFHRVSDASKVALVFLVQKLIADGFVLLDIQFMTDHLRQFGAIEIEASDYAQRLDDAMSIPAVWST